ncbi:MAG: hypothetical protein WC992_08910 [Acholeplasmataceae bacterium]
MYELDKVARNQILTQKIEAYKNQLYSAKLDVKVAEIVEDERAKEAATAVVKKILQALEYLLEEQKTLLEEE